MKEKIESDLKRQSRGGMTPIGDLISLDTKAQEYSSFGKKAAPKKQRKEATTREQRSAQNRRGRKNPSKVPAKLTRTSAFLPQSTNLITDSDFEKVYIVPGHSILRISGRELGVQHRDALYTLFRVTPSTAIPPEFKDLVAQAVRENEVYLCAQASWRELLELSDVSPHVNNIRTLKNLLQDFQKVIFEEIEGKPEDILERQKQGKIGGKGSSIPILSRLEWSGDGLNDTVTVIYGESVQKAFRDRCLVSLDFEVQLKLTSGYAKSIWPFIDGQPNYTYLPEDTIAALIGIDIWTDEALVDGKIRPASNLRRDFRKKCRKAFKDMQDQGGIREWSVNKDKKRKDGLKTHTYYYTHGKTRQLELQMFD